MRKVEYIYPSKFLNSGIPRDFCSESNLIKKKYKYWGSQVTRSK